MGERKESLDLFGSYSDRCSSGDSVLRQGDRGNSKEWKLHNKFGDLWGYGFYTSFDSVGHMIFTGLWACILWLRISDLIDILCFQYGFTFICKETQIFFRPIVVEKIVYQANLYQDLIGGGGGWGGNCDLVSWCLWGF